MTAVFTSWRSRRRGKAKTKLVPADANAPPNWGMRPFSTCSAPRRQSTDAFAAHEVTTTLLTTKQEEQIQANAALLRTSERELFFRVVTSRLPRFPTDEEVDGAIYDVIGVRPLRHHVLRAIKFCTGTSDDQSARRPDHRPFGRSTNEGAGTWPAQSETDPMTKMQTS